MATRSPTAGIQPMPASPQPESAALRFRLVAALLVLIFAGTCLSYVQKAGRGASAFLRWHNQIAELTTDEDIYLRHAFPNPPMMALVLYPLVLLPPFAGALTWFWLKAAMALASFLLAFRLVETPETPVPRWAQLLVMLLTIRPVVGDLTHGNVNLFILFLAMLGLFAFQHGRDLLAGLLLGLAAACKVTPLLFLPYFVWKRAWWTVAGFAAGLATFGLLVPALFLGWARNAELLASWTRQMVQPYVQTGAVFYTEHKNQSLPGVVMRLTTRSPSFTAYRGLERIPVAYHNLANLPPAQAQWVVRGAMLAFVAVVLAACRTPRDERPGWRLPAEFSIIFLGMLLFSERTWKHHAVTLLLPWTVVLYALATVPRRQTLAAASAGLAGCLLLVTTDGIVPEPWADLPEVYGVHLAIHLLLLAALAALLIGNARPLRPQPEEPS